MYIEVLKSKISQAVITQTELHYEGSITIDQTLLAAAGLVPGEKVHVLNENTGARIETYTIPGRPGSGEICLNGPAARHGCVGDKLIILSYALVEVAQAKDQRPQIIRLDERNQIKK